MQSLIYVGETRISVNVFVYCTNSIANITNAILEFTETPCPIHRDCLNLRIYAFYIRTLVSMTWLK